MQNCFNMILSVTLLIPYGICIAAQGYTVTQISSGSGLYYSQLGKAKTSDLNWKTLTYVDLQKFEQTIYNLSSYESQLENFFNKYKQYIHYHDKKYKQYKNELIEIQTKINYIAEMLDIKRKNRDLFNFSVADVKYLTGIPASDDALYYNEAMKQYEGDKKYSELLAKEQIHIVSNTITKLNESICPIQQYFHQLNDNFLKVYNLTTEIHKLGVEFKISDLLHGILATLNLIKIITLEQLDILLNSILFAKQNILHPQILKPSTLMNQLKEITYSLPPEREFPIPLTTYNGHTLLKISTLLIYFSDYKLVIIIIIPLTEIGVFDLYRLYPLPIPLNESKYQLILPDYDYLLVTKNQEKNIQFINVFDNCKLIFPKRYLCKIQSGVIRNNGNTCEIMLLQPNLEYIPKQCNVKIINQEIFLWQNLPNNYWIIATSKSKNVTLNCRNNSEQVFLIQDTNVLYLERNCKAYISSVELLAEAVQHHDITDIIPNIALGKTNYCEIINLKDLLILHFETHAPINLKLEELKYEEGKLREFVEHIDTILRKHMKCYPFYYIIISISVINFLTAICLYKCCIYPCCRCIDKFCCNFKRNCIIINSRSHIEQTSIQLQYTDDSCEAEQPLREFPADN